MYLPILLLSFFGTNGTMFYILFRHRLDRRYSVSLHAAIDRSSQASFALGHFIGGLAFLYFSYRYFYVEKDSTLLFGISAAGFLAEQTQAILPNKNGFEKIHTVAAFSMALFMSQLILCAPFVIHLDLTWLAVYIGLIVVLCFFGVRAVMNRPKFYQTQMLFFSSFYLFLLILLHGTQN